MADYGKHVRVRGSRELIRRRIKQTVLSPQMKQLLMSRVAHHLMSKVHKAFLVKSEGKTDELGLTWPSLSRKTIAARPIRSGDRKGLSTGRTRGLLTPAQDKQWRGIFRSHLIILMSRGYSQQHAAAKAGQLAWSILKSRAECRDRLHG